MTSGVKIDINAAIAGAFDADLKGRGPGIMRFRVDRCRFDAVRQPDGVPALAGKAAHDTRHRSAG